MIALLVALSFATAASHGHKSAHPHKHKHAPVHADRCTSDAQRIQGLERRLGSGGVRQAELSKLELELESAIDRARQDCRS